MGDGGGGVGARSTLTNQIGRIFQQCAVQQKSPFSHKYIQYHIYVQQKSPFHINIHHIYVQQKSPVHVNIHHMYDE